jgi:hypothetical protein
MISPRTLGIVLAAAAAVACGGPADQSPASAGPASETGAPAVAPARLQRVTPILVVEAIEPVLPFWEALGFAQASPSWVDGKLVFVSMAKDGLELHYHTKADMEVSIPAAADMLADTTSLVYLTVDNLDRIVAGLGDAEVVIPRRRTAWGADEIYVKEPGGNVIAFAAFGR